MIAEIIISVGFIIIVIKFLKMIRPSSVSSRSTYRNYNEALHEDEKKDPITQEMVGLKAKMDSNATFGNTRIWPP